MLEKKKLWILSELFYPETTSTAYIMTDLAKKLSEKYEVHVLCGNPTYDTTDNIVPLDNITVHRINDKKIDKNNRIKRLVRALTLSNKMVSFLSSKHSSLLARANDSRAVPTIIASPCKKRNHPDDRNGFFFGKVSCSSLRNQVELEVGKKLCTMGEKDIAKL